MDRKYALALVFAAFAAGPAAAEGPLQDMQPPVSTATRADVVADMQQARQSGVDSYADGYNPLTHFRSGRTREDVTREYIDARGAVAALNGEDSGSAWLARREPARAAQTQLAATPLAD